jgi:uncharacterized protein (TIGR02996 family)
VTIAAELLADICVSPWDDAPRLILADVLEENGEAERGELIRVQITLANELPCRSDDGKREPFASVLCRIGPCSKCRLRQREEDLLDVLFSRPRDIGGGYHVSITAGWHAKDQPIWKLFPPGGGPEIANVDFSRGFVSHVTCDEKVWLEHGSAIVACQPVTGVTLPGKEPMALREEWGWAFRMREIPVEDSSAISFHLWHGSAEMRANDGFFPTWEEAASALSRSAVALARRLARLPALEDR